MVYKAILFYKHGKEANTTQPLLSTFHFLTKFAWEHVQFLSIGYCRFNVFVLTSAPNESNINVNIADLNTLDMIPASIIAIF